VILNPRHGHYKIWQLRTSEFQNGKVGQKRHFMRGNRKISLAHDFPVINKAFSQNISNQLSLCINFQNLDPKIAENFQQHHNFSTK